MKIRDDKAQMNRPTHHTLLVDYPSFLRSVQSQSKPQKVQQRPKQMRLQWVTVFLVPFGVIGIGEGATEHRMAPRHRRPASGGRSAPSAVPTS